MNQPGVLQGLGQSTICEYVAVWMSLNGCLAERCVYGELTDGGLGPVLDGLEGDGAAHCRGPGLVEEAQAEDRACSKGTK